MALVRNSSRGDGARMVSSRMAFVLAGALLMLTATRGSAQSSADTAEVVKLGVLEMKRLLGASTVSFDPVAARARHAHAPVTSGSHAQSTMSALEGVPGVTFGSFEAARTCGALPSSCKMVGSEAAMAASPPEFGSDSARLRINTMLQTHNKRQPIEAWDVLIHLKKTSAGWSVVRTETLRQS